MIKQVECQKRAGSPDPSVESYPWLTLIMKKRKAEKEKYSNKEIAHFYFKSRISSPDRWECACGVIRTQASGHGFGNLLNHIFSQHPNYVEEMDQEKDRFKLVSSKAHNIFGWLDLICRARMFLLFLNICF